MQPEPKKRVTVNVLGNEYLLKGDSSPEQIQVASEYVDGILRKLLKTNSHVNQQKLLVLTCINLADELIRLKKEIITRTTMRQMQIRQDDTGQNNEANQGAAQQKPVPRSGEQQKTNQQINPQQTPVQPGTAQSAPARQQNQQNGIRQQNSAQQANTAQRAAQPSPNPTAPNRQPNPGQQRHPQ